MTKLFVCSTCRRGGSAEHTGGAKLREHVEAALADNPDVAIQSVQCLMGCEQGCNVHLRAPGKFGYVIGRFEPNAGSAQALADYIALYQQSDTGRVPFKLWPQGIKGHFVARIPALEDAS